MKLRSHVDSEDVDQILSIFTASNQANRMFFYQMYALIKFGSSSFFPTFHHFPSSFLIFFPLFITFYRLFPLFPLSISFSPFFPLFIDFYLFFSFPPTFYPLLSFPHSLYYSLFFSFCLLLPLGKFKKNNF